MLNQILEAKRNLTIIDTVRGAVAAVDPPHFAEHLEVFLKAEVTWRGLTKYPDGATVALVQDTLLDMLDYVKEEEKPSAREIWRLCLRGWRKYKVDNEEPVRIPFDC